MDWIKIEDKEPSEQDGLILVSNGTFIELVYIENGLYKKPWKFDKNDTPTLNRQSIIYWYKIDLPICNNIYTKQNNY